MDYHLGCHGDENDERRYKMAMGGSQFCMISIVRLFVLNELSYLLVFIDLLESRLHCRDKQPLCETGQGRRLCDCV